MFKDINLKELFQLMEEHDIAETTLQNGKAMVTVKRNKEPVLMNAAAVLDRSHEYIAGKDEPGLKPGLKPVEEKGKVEEIDEETAGPVEEGSARSYHEVLAPLVGTFYEASAPDVEPFVEVGDQVNVGDVLCIVEAMKSMNEIQSDVKGVVKEICVENANMVEFEQVLFKIDTSG
ncbi:MAG: acetyl-CoA carboxylase biotin carboxyl carrier protein [Candidatus Aminicenantes bacterium]|nr:MAG: acetyl-CoA carboxylase biotin carboxyl carrier protein [Candidatus Aminicenantes bacterium]